MLPEVDDAEREFWELLGNMLPGKVVFLLWIVALVLFALLDDGFTESGAVLSSLLAEGGALISFGAAAWLIGWSYYDMASRLRSGDTALTGDESRWGAFCQGVGWTWGRMRQRLSRFQGVVRD